MSIGEIARRAGVSRSTVSYALSGKRSVSDGTKRRIQKVIDELGYRPNANARALKEGRTRTLGLVIPPVTSRLTDIQLGFVASVVEAASRADLDVLLSPSGGEYDRSFERVVTGQRVDGIILMEIQFDDARVARICQTGLPLVTIGRTAIPDDLCWVDIDFETLIGRCVHHLADLGHRHVALINHSPELVASGHGSARRALRGFSAAVVDRGMTGFAACAADDVAGGESVMGEILAEHPEVTAAVTLNEAALPGIHYALEKAGLRVPSDFSLTGVVARRGAEDCRPSLTAADISAHEVGSAAVDLLRERIAEPSTPSRRVLLVPPISLRASTGPVPATRRW